MKCQLSCGIAVWLICAASLLAQSAPSSTEQKPSDTATKASGDDGLRQAKKGSAYGALDVLSDTMGVNFDPYLARVLHDVKLNWYNVIPQSAKAPIMRKGTVVIEFAILKDGRVSGMRLINSAGDVALDRGAWSGIVTSNPFPPLPAEFAGQYLGLRMKFLYNPSHDDLQAQGSSSDKPTWLDVSPAFLQLNSGATQQFSASAAANSAVIWNLSCAVAFCGSISVHGLYTAPRDVSNSMTVTVIATLAADPTRTGSAVVSLQPGPSR
ncbi:MAG: TonB family protein [Terriglobales bacterium]|jgi:TonB family protein